MKKKILAGLTIGLFMFVMVGMAQAATFQVSFEVSEFHAINFGWPPPVYPVGGSIWYVSTNPYGPISAITQVELSIGPHLYVWQELVYEVYSDGADQVQMIGGGGDVAAIFGGSVNEDVFFLSWLVGTGVPLDFYYTVAGGRDLWGSAGFDRFTIVGEVSAVPIPGAVYLFGSGLIGLAGFRRKFKKQATQTKMSETGRTFI
jgi:hypothetical protein